MLGILKMETRVNFFQSYIFMVRHSLQNYKEQIYHLNLSVLELILNWVANPEQEIWN